jgi:hypothetical protein
MSPEKMLSVTMPLNVPNAPTKQAAPDMCRRFDDVSKRIVKRLNFDALIVEAVVSLNRDNKV